MRNVDVVIPCYNYGRFLKQCTESILSQAGVMVRVLIIDDSSSDNTSTVAQKFVQDDPRVELIRHKDNIGHIRTYNEGISWSTGDYFLLLSADDYLLPGALCRAVNLMETHADVGFTYSQALELREGEFQADETLPLSKVGFQILTGREFIASNGSKNVVPAPTAVIRGALQRKVGGYREELPHSGDMEMWLRLAAHGSVGRHDVHQAVYRRHGKNMSDAYYCDFGLLDLKHKLAAIESFFAGDGVSLYESDLLKNDVIRSLSLEAIGLASVAFNEDDHGASLQLSAFAEHIYPSIRRSLPWFKLEAKRLVGVAAWRKLQGFL